MKSIMGILFIPSSFTKEHVKNKRRINFIISLATNDRAKTSFPKRGRKKRKRSVKVIKPPDAEMVIGKKCRFMVRDAMRIAVPIPKGKPNPKKNSHLKILRFTSRGNPDMSGKMKYRIPR